MKRLVYSPDVKAYIKADSGIVDVSNYIISGSVTRKINQISTAELTLRNPNFRFTYDTARKEATGETYPVFHPMDPIFITMSRYKDKEILVFTGYLDEVPYLQLFPGPCSLSASCTLKKLNLTWFDPALPYTTSFMQKLGWTSNYSGSMFNLNEELTTNPNSTDVTDGSFANLLYNTMVEIGNWEDDQIYIQPLPPQIGEVAIGLYKKLGPETDKALSDLNGIIKRIIGSDSYGKSITTGGGPGGTDTGTDSCSKIAGNNFSQNAKIFAETFSVLSGLNLQAVGAWMLGENDVSADQAAAGRAGVSNDQNWLNAGKTDTHNTSETTKDGYSKPASAAQLTVDFLNNDPAGYYDGIRAAKGKGPTAILQAVVKSPWASSHYNGDLTKNLKYVKVTDCKSDKTTDSKNTTKSDSGSSSSNSLQNTTSLFNACAAISDQKRAYGYGDGHGESLSKVAKNTNERLDCSSSTSLALKAAGMFPADTAITSGTFATSWGKPGKGTDFTVWADSGHVFIEFHGEHAGYQFNTSGHPSVSGPRLGKFNYSPHPTMVARHWSGDGTDAINLTSAPNAEPASKPKAQVTTTNTNTNTRTKKPTLIVLHSTESSNSSGLSDISGVNSGLQNKGLSVQVVTDAEGNCGFFVDDDKYAKHCAAYNDVSFGIEQIGFAAKTEWTDKQYDIAARWIAYWSDKHDIPIQKAEVVDGISFGTVTKPGIARHSDLGLSGSAGEGRSDPGPHYDLNKVMQLAKGYAKGGNLDAGSTVGSNITNGSSDAGSVTLEDVKTIARSAAFSTYLEGPTMDDLLRSELLTGRKSLLNDKPLLPFIEEICTASQRNFMSLPNGDFFAFYPDYFGALGRVPYWEIQDIEILDGQIQLSDDALATHVYVVGDNSAGLPDGQINWLDETRSKGVVTIFDAFSADFLDGTGFVDSKDQKKTLEASYNDTAGTFSTTTGKTKVKNPDDIRGYNKKDDGTEFHLSQLTDAVAFVERYGLRPKYIQAPLIRNTLYEIFAAYQQFQLLWSQQFVTQFSFTFMPELYPGGLVALPNHGLSMYIEEVTHTFDYESGFQTQAQLSAPSGLRKEDESGDNVRASQGLIRPLNTVTLK